MKAQIIVAASSVSAAGLTAALLVVWQGYPAATGERLDLLVSGSIGSQSSPLDLAAPPAQFTVSNLKSSTVCLAERGGALTSRSRSFWAPPDCEDVWSGLSAAQSWTQNEDGTVTLADENGDLVLTLVRGSGFSYEAFDASGADIAWLMLP